MSKLQTEFKRIDNILFEDAGTNGANDYMAQMSWILFLKYLDDLEETRKDEAVFHDAEYSPLFKKEFQWGQLGSTKEIRWHARHFSTHDWYGPNRFCKSEVVPHICESLKIQVKM
jgi:type I restriction-modification system DNA methylase subunit